MRHKQNGMTLTSFLIVLAIGGFFIYIGMKLVPMYTEYYAVKSVLKGMSNESDIALKDPAQIKEMFFRRMNINFSANIKQEHVKIDNVGRGNVINVNYEVRKPLIYNLDVVGKFSASQDLSRGAASAQ